MKQYTRPTPPSPNPAVWQLPVQAFDSETYRMQLGYVCPRMVCLSRAFRASDGRTYCEVKGTGEPNELLAMVDAILNGQCRGVAHSAAFDLAVLATNYPQYFPVIWELLWNGYFHCTRVREKLINLYTTGDLEYMVGPTGEKQKIEYKLAWLGKKWLGKDRSAEKTSNDSWRTNFSVLDNVPVTRWPQEATQYVAEDSLDCLGIYECQEQKRQEIIQMTGRDPFQTEWFQVCVDFCLYLMSSWGICVDAEKVLEFEREVDKELSGDKIALLLQYEILRPAQPPRPYKKGTKRHVPDCRKKWVETVDGVSRTVECNCPQAMTEAVAESIDRGKLAAFVQQLVATYPSTFTLKRTPASDKFPEGNISVDAEWLEEHAGLNPVLDQMAHRNGLLKIRDTEIPRMMMKDEKGNSIKGYPAPFVHPRFDVLKETGRTSSFGDDSYPSINAQNVDERVRRCYKAPPGYLLFSVDIKQMELCTLAQTCLWLFGQSEIAEKINGGVDLHAYLGAQIAVASNAMFQQHVAGLNVYTRDDVYKMFLMYQESKHKEHKDFFKHFRKLAKPTGLGYPGGLGAETFIQYAKATYEVEIDLATSELLRDVWKATYPEMEQYFRYINDELGDRINEEKDIRDKKTGEMKTVKLYAYDSPFGMYRAGAVYCAAANGLGLQTPSAEGAKLGCVWNVTRACYDRATPTILSDDDRGVACRPIAFIHDEVLGIVREDNQASDRVKYIQQLVASGMKVVCPDINIGTDAVLMRNWDSEAQPKYDHNGNLVVWEPEKKQ